MARLSREQIGWLSLAAGAACSAAALSLDASEPSPHRVLVIALLSQGLWVGMAVGVASFWPSPSVAAHLGLGPGRLSLGVCLALVVGFVALSAAVHGLLVVGEVRHTGGLARLDEVVTATRVPSPWLTWIAMAAVPGFAEELLFRGLIQRTLGTWLRPTWAIAAAALAFALAHGDPVHSLGALPLGLYLGVVAHRAGSIRPAIACHVVNNSLGVVFARGLPGALPAVLQTGDVVGALPPC